MKLSRFFLLATLFGAGCDVATAPPPPEPAPAPKPKPAEPAVSEESKRIAAYYASVQARLLAQGKLRQDFNPPDAPFNADTLVRNFEKVALYDEYTNQEGVFIEEQTSSYLRRWQKPVRVGLHFGKSVTSAQRREDRKFVSAYAARLAGLTGLNIRLTSLKNANFVMLFLNRDEQKVEPAMLAPDVPQLLPSIVREIETSPRNIFCVAYALSNADNPTDYSGAVILVKAEHSDVMRKSCIEEEMTQALGLANDDPTVRPSIFNDDEEFALLTRHDEILLKMLYDPRLRVGMTPERARPLLHSVAEDALKQSHI
ncbi:DUF2927 domain-containing protein [Neptunicoccus cionae]|uniref:DUF2927 domain-containing protein n=1 Tax=Neptunicoccus cionae TaxID=2035344 RepID=A0A916QUT0_9RHOB|nr:DUF2927 domain-containing protein [Amylibacter cionae]GGA13384.1 hypothetical protein GCM10011498_11680 [Amylibacter cionae]